MKSAAEIASAAIGATVAVTTIRDVTDGSLRYTVSYSSDASHWLCRHRFHSLEESSGGTGLE